MLTYKQNLHTHSTYCDGRDTPREMVEIALQKGFQSIGFSGHSYMYYVPEHRMSREGMEAYFREIQELKAEYAGKIKIFCGIEYDIYSDLDISAYDYAIGSVHYLRKRGGCIDFDRPADWVADIIQKDFAGDGMAYAHQYYEELSDLPQYGKFDIVGHFDLIAKHAETRDFFDCNSKEYLSCAFDAARALAGKIPYFEVNTGAIARGYRTTPYPAIPIIMELKRLGFGPVITSDCHDGRMLDCCFDDAQRILQECGFEYYFVLDDEGFVPVKL